MEEKLNPIKKDKEDYISIRNNAKRQMMYRLSIGDITPEEYTERMARL